MGILGAIDNYAGWLVAVVAGLTALTLLARKAVHGLASVARRVNDAFDTLLGRDEIRHPDTGVVLVPATPGLGRRLADMESTIARLADNEDRITRLEKKFDSHVEHSRHIEELRSEEATEMWKAIRAVAETSPAPLLSGETPAEVSQTPRGDST